MINTTLCKWHFVRVVKEREREPWAKLKTCVCVYYECLHVRLRSFLEGMENAQNVCSSEFTICTNKKSR